MVNGDQEWYMNGVLHRIGGYACKYRDGSKEWWIKGIQYTEEEYKEKVREIC